MRRFEIWDADHEEVLLAAALEELADETRYPHLLVLPQSRTEALLLEALRDEPNAEGRFGCELTGLVPATSSVGIRCRTPAGEEALGARVVAGCDGAHSTVREILGASTPTPCVRWRSTASGGARRSGWASTASPTS